MDESGSKLTSCDFSANSPNPTVGLDASIATLHQAENQVRRVVSRRFDEAVKNEDLASIERFFKIFPLLNMHKEGLQNFTQYLYTKLVHTSKKKLKQAVDTQPGIREPTSSLLIHSLCCLKESLGLLISTSL